MNVFYCSQRIFSIIKSEKYSIYNIEYNGYELIIPFEDYSKGDILKLKSN